MFSFTTTFSLNGLFLSFALFINRLNGIYKTIRMWSKLLTEVRPSASTPYFLQHGGDKAVWFGQIDHVYAKLGPRLKHYNVRFSTDLLTRYTLTTFEDHDVMNELHENHWMQIRTAAHKIYCQSRSINFEISILEHQSQKDLDSYIGAIVDITWPRNQIIMTSRWLPSLLPADRLLTTASKPENDSWELDPWYMSLLDR